jgi:hypothetical protein
VIAATAAASAAAEDVGPPAACPAAAAAEAAMAAADGTGTGPACCPASIPAVPAVSTRLRFTLSSKSAYEEWDMERHKQQNVRTGREVKEGRQVEDNSNRFSYRGQLIRIKDFLGEVRPRLLNLEVLHDLC